MANIDTLGERTALLRKLMEGPKGASVQPTGPFGPPGGIDNGLWNTLTPPSGPMPGLIMGPDGKPIDFSGTNAIHTGQPDPITNNPTPNIPPIFGTSINPGAGMDVDFAGWLGSLTPEQRAAYAAAPGGLFQSYLNVQNQAYGAATNTNMVSNGVGFNAGVGGAGGVAYPQPLAGVRPAPGSTPQNPGSMVRQTAAPYVQPNYSGANPWLHLQQQNNIMPDVSGTTAGPVPGDGSLGWTAPSNGYTLPTYGQLGLTAPQGSRNMPGNPNMPPTVGGTPKLTNPYSNPSLASKLPKGLPKRTISGAGNLPKKNLKNLKGLTRFLLGY